MTSQSSEPAVSLAPDLTMSEVMERIPGARRALFRNYHIGGCSSCAFSPDETLKDLCVRNENLDVMEVISKILEGHAADEAIFLSPIELKVQLDSDTPPILIDIRSREEHEAVKIDGARFLESGLMQELKEQYGEGRAMVFFDHTGGHVLDAASYFIGHGFTSIRALRGGIDAWAKDVDKDMPRYHLE